VAVTAFWYAKSFLAAFNAEIDFVSIQNTVALTSSSYTPNQDTHDYFDDVTNELGTANGYTAGGQALGTPTLATTLNVLKFDSVDPQWTTGGGETLTARRAVYRQNTAGAATTDPLICWVDFGQDETASNGGTFTIVQDAAGIATITAADATGFP
jgi:hypothetical protein